MWQRHRVAKKVCLTIFGRIIFLYKANTQNPASLDLIVICSKAETLPLDHASTAWSKLPSGNCSKIHLILTLIRLWVQFIAVTDWKNPLQASAEAGNLAEVSSGLDGVWGPVTSLSSDDTVG
jgi:hypothetical protein